MSWGSPVLSEAKFADAAVVVDQNAEVMTVEGTMGRLAALLVVLCGAAIWPWTVFFHGYIPASGSNPAMAPDLTAFIWGGMIAGFILCLIITFKPTTAPYLAVPYAFCEGVFLGAISAFFEAMYNGIAIQAAAATIGVTLIMAALYVMRVINATAKFRAVVLSATLGIAAFYLLSLVLSLIGVQPEFIKSLLWGNGILGLGFSAVVCVIAALNLIMDFDLVERGAESRAPKYMSWFAAFGTLVTLVWLYLEILRFLSKLRSR